MVVVMEVMSMSWVFLDRSQSLLIRRGISVISAGSIRSFVTLIMEMAVVTMTCVPASLVVVMVVMELVEVTMTWVLGHPLTSILCRHGQPCQ